MVEKTLKVSKIHSGTVIDHIPAGYALDVLRILGIHGKNLSGVVTLAMNVPSQKMGRKDIVKVEGRELSEQEVNKIALIAPDATINIIRNYEVVEKIKVKLPNVIRNVIKCPNPTCITNGREPIEPRFIVESRSPLRLRCYYCGRSLDKSDILRQF